MRLLGNHIKLAQLETQTMMILDPFPPLSTTMQRTDADAKAKKCQYESIFMQLADENRYAKVAIKFGAADIRWASIKSRQKKYRGDEQYA